MADTPEPTRSDRPCAPASHAKRLLGIDPRTARKRIRDGTLPGFISLGDKYFFFTGDGESDGRGDGGGLKAELAAVRAELDIANRARTELHTQLISTAAKLAAAEEAKRVLLAANSLTIEAAKKLEDGSHDLFKVVELQRDLLAQFVAPDDLEGIHRGL